MSQHPISVLSVIERYLERQEAVGADVEQLTDSSLAALAVTRQDTTRDISFISLFRGWQWGPTLSDIARDVLPLQIPERYPVPSGCLFGLLTDFSGTSDADRVQEEKDWAQAYLHANPVDRTNEAGLDIRVIALLESQPNIAQLLAYVSRDSASTNYLERLADDRATSLGSDETFDSLDRLLQFTEFPDGQNVTNDFLAQIIRANAPQGLRQNYQTVNVLRILQHALPLAIVVTLYHLISSQVARRTAPLAKVTTSCQITVITKRIIVTQNQEDPNVLPTIRRYQRRVLVFDDTSLATTINNLASEVRSLFSTPSDSQVLLQDDHVIVIGINCFSRVTNGPTNLLNFPSDVPTPLNPLSIHDQIVRYLSTVSANALKYPWVVYEKENMMKAMFLNMPVMESNLCIYNAFLYLRCLQSDTLTMERDVSRGGQSMLSVKKHLGDLTDKLVRLVTDIGDRPTSYFWKAIRRCLFFADHESLRDFIGPAVMKPIYVGFIHQMNTRVSPSYPMVKIDCVANCETSYPEMIFDLDDREYILAYYDSHVFVTTMGYYRSLVSTVPIHKIDFEAQTESALRTDEVHTISPIALDRQKTKGLDKRKINEVNQPWTRCDSDMIYSDRNKATFFACDLETYSCERCQTDHAYTAALVYGFHSEHRVVFSGSECPHNSGTSCIASLLRFMKDSFGFRRFFNAFSSDALLRVVYCFNAANFDNFFILHALNFYDEPYELILVDGRPYEIRWGQYCFRDFAKIYPGCSLAKLFETISKQETRFSEYKPDDGKWSCFPYGAIGIHQYITVEDMNSLEIWGHKLCDEEPYKSMGVAGNQLWWSEHVGPCYNDATLEDYCMQDTVVLFYCIAVDFDVAAVGSANGKKYDITLEMTASSRSLTKWRQCYQKEEISSPPNIKDIGLYYSDGSAVSLHDAIDQSYLGGAVVRYYDEMHTPALMERINDYNQRTGKDYRIWYVDFNSRYPADMYQSRMPTNFQEIIEYPVEVVLDSDSEESNHYIDDLCLYHCAVQYPKDKSSLQCKVSGVTVTPMRIPYSYDDPCAAHGQRFQFTWGVELRSALLHGATITLRMCIVFHGDYVFRDYIGDTYKKRCESDSSFVKMCLKHDMNSSYGKMSSKRRPVTSVVTSIADIPGEDTIVNVIKMPPTISGTVKYVVSHMNGKPHLGYHKAIASFITARARSRLAIVRYELSKCMSVLGTEPRVIYTDTDSLHICALDLDHPYTKDFFSRWFNDKTLGLLKQEVPGGISYAKFLAKKVNVCCLTNVSTRDATVQAMLELANKDPKAFMVKCKGIAKKLARPEDILRVASKLIDECPFFIPVSFTKNIRDGVAKKEMLQKKLVSRDQSRMAPDPFTGFCGPLLSPELV